MFLEKRINQFYSILEVGQDGHGEGPKRFSNIKFVYEINKCYFSDMKR